MARIAIVGDGPAGLSAALFLAKNDHDVVVFGKDSSLMEYAELHNYLGMPGVLGSEFQDVARQQVVDAGAVMRMGEEVTAVAPDGEVVGVRAGSDDDAEAGEDAVAAVEDVEDFDYVVVAGGKSSMELLRGAGARVDEGAVVVDGDARTSLERVYAAGHLVRPERSQAIISAGLGAAAAIDILSRESGSDVHDWDSPD